MKPVQQARAPWREVVLVCRKCARKAGGGSFRKALKAELKRTEAGKSMRVLESSCLDLCPKGRIVIATRAGLDRGRLLVVAPDAAGATAAAILHNRAIDSAPAHT